MAEHSEHTDFSDARTVHKPAGVALCNRRTYIYLDRERTRGDAFSDSLSLYGDRDGDKKVGSSYNVQWYNFYEAGSLYVLLLSSSAVSLHRRGEPRYDRQAEQSLFLLLLPLAQNYGIVFSSLGMKESKLAEILGQPFSGDTLQPLVKPAALKNETAVSDRCYAAEPFFLFLSNHAPYTKRGH